MEEECEVRDGIILRAVVVVVCARETYVLSVVFEEKNEGKVLI
jgi:hypothetical protein